MLKTEIERSDTVEMIYRRDIRYSNGRQWIGQKIDGSEVGELRHVKTQSRGSRLDPKINPPARSPSLPVTSLTTTSICRYLRLTDPASAYCTQGTLARLYTFGRCVDSLTRTSENYPSEQVLRTTRAEVISGS